MYEVEVKVEADHAAVREQLERTGARRQGTVRQVDTYYDAPHRDFAATDEALRIRRTDPEEGEPAAAVTYKGPLVEAESKTRTEAETTVADGDAMAAVLEGLGYDPAATVAKDRDRYALDGYAVLLDDVEGLGEFLEVETDVESADAVESAREGALDLLASLGLDPDDQIRTSYLGLLLDAGGDPRLDNCG